MSSPSSSCSLTVYGDDLEPLYIAVMGSTGTGKSSFINLLTEPRLTTSDTLESCTDAVQCTEPFDFEGRTIALIDTPGFDDTKLRDAEVLQMIAAYLSFSHQSGKKLAGIIYLHRIVDNRLGGLSRRNFQMFRSLCGDTSLRHVIILTTMWDLVSSDVGEAREDELRNKDLFFAGAISKGAKMMRHANQEESAKGVIRAILEDHNEDVTLQIQKELAEGMSIDQTGAGVQLHKDLEALISLHREDMRSLTEDLQNAIKARDEETKKELEDERKRLREEIGRLVDDSRGLAGGYARRVKELEEKMRKAEVTRVQVERRERENLLGRMAEREIGFPGGIMEEHMHTLPSVEAKVQPMVGLWGAMCLMLAPFSLSWKNA